MLEFALQYAARGWPVFRLNGYKMPLKDSHGHLDATTDGRVIEQWWGGRRGARLNIGLATGRLVVVDADGPEGLAQLQALARANGGLPRTLVVVTARGFHFYYCAPADAQDPRDLRCWSAPRKKKGDPGFDIKAHGGYVVLPPSVNRKNGHVYAWADPAAPIAELPRWLVDFIRARGGTRVARDRGQDPQAAAVRASEVGLGDRPAWLDGEPPGLADRALSAMRRDELPDLLAALKKLAANTTMYDWFAIGGAIHDFDPGPDGLAIFKAWSKTSERHDTPEDQARCEIEWANYKKHKPGKELTTKATIYYRAGLVPDPVSKLATPSAGHNNRFNGTHALPASVATVPIQRQIRWTDTDEDGNPRPTCANAALAVSGLQISCSKDLFHEKMFVGGHVIEQWAGEIGDDAVLMLRRQVKRHYGFDPGERNMRDAAVQLCLEHSFNPVVDYLASVSWDGRERIGRWVADYLGVPDQPLACAIGRLMLIAAVRRARRPGTKFDQIIVLEGPEGTGKSSALRVLAGEENFSDQAVLGVSDREQQEALAGVWIHEIAELAGMRRTEVERIKAFASRTEDRARPAYGRFRVDVRRRGILVATTNADSYLKSDTGDRRFWPLATTTIFLIELARDRDQLWAEAAACEARGDSLVLDRALWEAAREAQAARQESDPWQETVHDAFVKNKVSDTSISHVLEAVLRMQPREYGQVEQTRAARVLRQLGFTRYQRRIGDDRHWRYRSVKSGDSGG